MLAQTVKAMSDQELSELSRDVAGEIEQRGGRVSDGALSIAVAALQQIAHREQGFVLRLRWLCEACDFTADVNAPGFAGDGQWHYRQPGNVRCGPIYAHRVAALTAAQHGSEGGDRVTARAALDCIDALDRDEETCRYCAGEGGRRRLLYSRFIGTEPQVHEGPWEHCWKCGGTGKLSAAVREQEA